MNQKNESGSLYPEFYEGSTIKN